MPPPPGMRWRCTFAWELPRRALSGALICIPFPIPVLTASMAPPPWVCPATSPFPCIPPTWRPSALPMMWYIPTASPPVPTGATVPPRACLRWKAPSMSWQKSSIWTLLPSGRRISSGKEWSCLPTTTKPPMPAPWTGASKNVRRFSVGRKNTRCGIWGTEKSGLPA